MLVSHLPPPLHVVDRAHHVHADTLVPYQGVFQVLIPAPLHLGHMAHEVYRKSPQCIFLLYLHECMNLPVGTLGLFIVIMCNVLTT